MWARTLTLAILIVVFFPWPTGAQDLTPLAPLPGTDPSLLCVLEQGTAHIGGEHGVAVRCPLGTLRGFTDVEGGTEVSGDPGKLQLNLSAGNRDHPGYVVVAPDVGKGLIVEDGRLRKLLLVRGARYGGSEFRARVRFRRGLTVCDRRGCVDVLRALRSRP
jgi:hypothetical protein